MSSKVKEAWQFCQVDNVDALKELVPSEVQPNSSTFDPTNHVHTLLMCAAAHGSVDCFRYLLKEGADPSIKNFSGYTALHWAAYTGRDECLNVLFGKNKEHKKGKKKESSSSDDESDNQYKVADPSSLLEATTEDGKTALHVAAYRGHLNFIKKLIDLGADVNAVTSNGWTALHFALTSNQKYVCKYLLSLNIQASAPDSQGKTISDIAESYHRNWFQEMVNKESKHK